MTMLWDGDGDGALQATTAGMYVLLLPRRASLYNPHADQIIRRCTATKPCYLHWPLMLTSLSSGFESNQHYYARVRSGCNGDSRGI